MGKMVEIKIGNQSISTSSPTYIIAEIGVNHNGSIDLAIKSIDAAKKCGADAVKFQLFQANLLASDDADLVTYQKKVQTNNQKEMLKQLELTKEQFTYLFNYCKQQKIQFLATPFDCESAIFLNQLGVEAFKVSSGDLTNYPLLKKLTTFQKPLLLSTGMSTMEEIKHTVSMLNLREYPFILFHCTSSYPALYEELHLNAIYPLQNEFQTIIGYSDHSLGIEVPIAAVSIGYKLIEKHFTLDKNLPGPDHEASLEPKEFKQMVESIRNIEKSFGLKEKKVTQSEEETKRLTRRSLYAAKDLLAGHMITEADLQILRPLAEIEAIDFTNVVGKTLCTNKRKGEPLSWSDFQHEVIE